MRNELQLVEPGIKNLRVPYVQPLHCTNKICEYRELTCMMKFETILPSLGCMRGPNLSHI